ncbi:hypothetical protein PG994_010329 [Apiospora phragmitis]|uniref:Uncharacterized protein n=1 Tax=Apiospora phragmitis TaxID=2905665 RepID=A0ABR1TPL5_9PEZI
MHQTSPGTDFSAAPASPVRMSRFNQAVESTLVTMTIHADGWKEALWLWPAKCCCYSIYYPLRGLYLCARHAKRTPGEVGLAWRRRRVRTRKIRKSKPIIITQQQNLDDASKPASFLYLPLELRLKIYDLALGAPCLVEPHLGKPEWHPRPCLWRHGQRIRADDEVAGRGRGAVGVVRAARPFEAAAHLPRHVRRLAAPPVRGQYRLARRRRGGALLRPEREPRGPGARPARPHRPRRELPWVGVAAGAGAARAGGAQSAGAVPEPGAAESRRDCRRWTSRPAGGVLGLTAQGCAGAPPRQSPRVKAQGHGL